MSEGIWEATFSKTELAVGTLKGAAGTVDTSDPSDVWANVFKGEKSRMANHTNK
jgi:hypothetical protein